MAVGRVMALDVGDKGIGVAVSDPLCITVRPLETVVRTDEPADVAAIAALIEEWTPQTLIVGLPLLPSGDHGTQARAVEAFVAALRPALDMPVEYWNESYTTQAAAERLRSRGIDPSADKAALDAEAAAVILEEWLREYGTTRR